MTWLQYVHQRNGKSRAARHPSVSIFFEVVRTWWLYAVMSLQRWRTSSCTFRIHSVLWYVKSVPQDALSHVSGACHGCRACPHEMAKGRTPLLAVWWPQAIQVRLCKRAEEPLKQCSCFSEHRCSLSQITSPNKISP